MRILGGTPSGVAAVTEPPPMGTLREKIHLLRPRDTGQRAVLIWQYWSQ